MLNPTYWSYDLVSLLIKRHSLFKRRSARVSARDVLIWEVDLGGMGMNIENKHVASPAELLGHV